MFKILVRLGMATGFNILLLVLTTSPLLAQVRSLNRLEAVINTEQSQADINLLTETLKNFFHGKLYQTESEMEINGLSEGSKVQILAIIKTIALAPNQFRSEIKLGNKNYSIISNGKKVWIYNSESNQYSITSLKDFQQSQDEFWIGIASSLFLDITQSIEEAKTQDNLSEKEIIKTILSFFAADLETQNLLLTGGLRNLEGKEYYAYEYTEKKAGYRLILLVSPQTKTLQQIHILGSEREQKIEIKETIFSHQENPPISDNTFSFSPTKDMKQVDSLALEPF